MTQVNIQKNLTEVRNAPADYQVFTVVTPAAAQTITFLNVKTIKFVKQVEIQATTGIRRMATGAVTFSGNVVTIQNSSFLTGELIHIEVIGYTD